MDRHARSRTAPRAPRWWLYGLLVSLIVFGSGQLGAATNASLHVDTPEWMRLYQAVVLPSAVAGAALFLGFRALPMVSDWVVNQRHDRAAQIRVWTELRDVLEQIRLERCPSCPHNQSALNMKAARGTGPGRAS